MAKSKVHRRIRNKARRSTGSDPNEDVVTSSEIQNPSAMGKVSLYAGALVLVILTISIYANTLSNGFVFDDRVIVEHNTLIQDFGNIGEIFTTNYWQPVNRNRGLYRPLTILSYSINYAINGLNPIGYHAVNILLHTFTVLMLYLLTIMVSRSFLVSIFSGVLFSVHPIHVEAVANVVGRAELLSAFFFLSAAVLYTRFRTQNNVRYATYIASLLAYFFAILSKENAVTFLIIPFLIDWLCHSKTSAESISHIVRSRYHWYLGFVGVLIGYLVVRSVVLGVFTPPDIAPLDNPLVREAPLDRILGGVFIFGKYLSLMVFPQNLSCDYGLDVLPLSDPLRALEFWLGVVSSIMVPLLLVYSVRRRRRDVTLYILLFLATYSITSNIFIVIGTPIAERLFYLPSVGLCCLAGCGVRSLLSFVSKSAVCRAAVIAALVPIVAVYSWRTYTRNQDWKSNYDLYLADVATYPRSVKLRKLLAGELLGRGLADDAIEHLSQAITIFPNYSDAVLTIAEAYRLSGDHVRHREMIQKASEMSPRNVRARLSLGRIYINEGKPDLAITELEAALQFDSSYDEARYNLGIAYYNSGNFAGVVEVLERDLRLTTAARGKQYFLLGASYEKLGRFEDAVNALQRGIEYTPNAINIREKLAIVLYRHLDRAHEALGHFQHILDKDPDYARKKNIISVMDAITKRNATPE